MLSLGGDLVVLECFVEGSDNAGGIRALVGKVAASARYSFWCDPGELLNGDSAGGRGLVAVVGGERSCECAEGEGASKKGRFDVHVVVVDVDWCIEVRDVR